jgi:hypothetical protein
VIQQLILSPESPSEDFAIDHLIDWANTRGVRTTDDREAMGQVTFSTHDWQHILHLATELGAYRIRHNLITKGKA